MYNSGFVLVSDLVQRYICNRLQVQRSAINETVSTESHAQWIINGLDVPLTVTATRVFDTITILNFLSKESVRAVQVDLNSLDVEVPLNLSDITPTLVETFTTYIDEQLVKQGGISSLGKESTKRREPQEEKQRIPESVPVSTPIFKNTSSTSRPADMPDFEDEYELQSNRRQGSQGIGAFGIGERDLNPPGLPKYPELKPYIDPLAGDVSGGGMYPTADHPIFGQRQGNTSRPGVPPGARYDDPYGEDNLEDMGMGLPGNLRRQGPPSGGPPFGGSPFGGSSFGGPSFGPTF